MLSKRQIAIYYLIILLVATSCILYEFTLAQLLTAIIGNSIVQYTLTIGFYLASLGLGALYLNFFDQKHQKEIETLFKIELFLFVLGGFSPVLLLLCEFLIRKTISSTSEHYVQALMFFACLFSSIIGFLSGLEIPLLIKIGQKKYSVSASIVMGLDYIGTFVGIMLFSFFLFPEYGIFKTSAVTSFATLIILLWIFFFHKNNKPTLLGLIALAMICIVYMFFAGNIENLIINKIYLAKT